MSKTLANLVSDLKSEVPAVGSVPSDPQYERAIKDAVVEFGRRCGLTKTAILNIVAGTASYTFPADFLKLVMLTNPATANGIIIASEGLIPTHGPRGAYCETYDVMGQTITFIPTPTYSLARYYQYKAGWALTGTVGSEAYETMGDDEAQIVMIKAKGLAQEKIMNSMSSGGAISYSFGAVKVDKSDGVADISKLMYELHGQFSMACDQYNGAVLL
jgi:hypothetical protein